MYEWKHENGIKWPNLLVVAGTCLLLNHCGMVRVPVLIWLGFELLYEFYLHMICQDIVAYGSSMKFPLVSCRDSMELGYIGNWDLSRRHMPRPYMTRNHSYDNKSL